MNHESDPQDQTTPLGDEPEDETVQEVSPFRSGTLIVPQSGRLRKSSEEEADGGTHLNGRRQVYLVLRGMVEFVSFEHRPSFTVGRVDLKKGGAVPDIDLSSYGAVQRGVSREHVRLEIRDDQLFITDLGSTNGTFLRGERIAPYTPYVIREEDEVVLGRLSLHIRFYEDTKS